MTVRLNIIRLLQQHAVFQLLMIKIASSKAKDRLLSLLSTTSLKDVKNSKNIYIWCPFVFTVKRSHLKCTCF